MAEETTTGIPTTMAKELTKTAAVGKRWVRTEDSEYNEQEYDSLVKLYERTLGSISEGEIVKGRIVAIGESEVSVDIGFKSEGIVPLAEFTKPDELKVGGEIEVFLESVEDKDGQLVLSRKRADFMRVWERVTKAFDTGEVLQGCVPPRLPDRRAPGA
jgi:small subunit ribosomal protein S1